MCKDGTILPLTQRGGTMGLELLPYKEGDNKRYPIVELTSEERWHPHRHHSYWSQHLQLEIETLDCIANNDFHVDSTKSISNEELQKLDNQSVNTCTTVKSTNLKNEDLVSATSETSIETETFHFPSNNSIYFNINKMDQFFDTKKVTDKISLECLKILE